MEIDKNDKSWILPAVSVIFVFIARGLGLIIIEPEWVTCLIPLLFWIIGTFSISYQIRRKQEEKEKQNATDVFCNLGLIEDNTSKALYAVNELSSKIENSNYEFIEYPMERASRYINSSLKLLNELKEFLIKSGDVDNQIIRSASLHKSARDEYLESDKKLEESLRDYSNNRSAK